MPMPSIWREWNFILNTSSGSIFNLSSCCIAVVSTDIVPSITSSFEASTSGSNLSMDKMYSPSDASFTTCCNFAMIDGRRSRMDFALELAGLKSVVFKTSFLKYKNPAQAMRRIKPAIIINFFTLHKPQISNQFGLWEAEYSEWGMLLGCTSIARRRGC